MTNPLSTVKEAAEKISKIHLYGATPKSMVPIHSLAHKILTALQDYERGIQERAEQKSAFQELLARKLWDVSRNDGKSIFTGSQNNDVKIAAIISMIIDEIRQPPKQGE
jgi:hypothetical protein